VLAANQLLGPDAPLALGDDEQVERIVTMFEPLVLDRRRERIQAVIDARLASVTVAFDAPHDPHNGAAVIRSCEAFGVQTLHVVERKESFLAASSVARGAEKWIDVVTYREPSAAIAVLREGGRSLVGAHPDGELLPEDLASVPSFALILGNERDGIADDLAAACDQRVKVPMRGFIDSLNVSVTAAIVLGAATRGRHGDLDARTKRRLYARALYLSVPRAERYLEPDSW
jgi:tRNA (guanosine-2'-O-)-methyltransferase